MAMLEKVRFVDPQDYSDVSPSRTYADLSPVSAYPYSPTPRAFKPTQETWKHWTRTPKDVRQALEKRLNFNHLYKTLHGSKQMSKTSGACEAMALNITDGFQYRVNGLLEEDDYKGNNLLNPKSLSPALSLQVKASDAYASSLNSLAKHENIPRENITIRRKSDVSSWSGGVSSLETRTVFLDYRPPRVIANKSRNVISEVNFKVQNSGRKRGVTTLDLPKKGQKLYTQKTFSTSKDKHGKESALGSLILDSIKTPKKDVKEELRHSGLDQSQHSKQERKKDPRISKDEPSEDIDIHFDDGISDILETEEKQTAALEQNAKKKVFKKRVKKIENNNVMANSVLQQLKPKILQSFKSSSVNRRRHLAPTTSSLKVMTGTCDSLDKKSDYVDSSKPEALQNSRITPKTPYKATNNVLQSIQKKVLKNLSNQFQSPSNYQSVPTLQTVKPISSTPLIKRDDSRNKYEANAHHNRMISEKRIRMSPSGQGFHFTNPSLSMSKFNDREAQLPSLGPSSGNEHKRLINLRQAQKVEPLSGQSQESFPGIRKPQRKKDNVSLSKIKVQEIMSAYGSFFIK